MMKEIAASWRTRMQNPPGLTDSTEREAFRLILNRVAEVNGKFLPNLGPGAPDTYLHPALGLARLRAQWIRPVNSWAPTSRKPREQLCQLTRHLFIEYPVPVYLEAAILDAGKRRYLDWCLHVASGQNIRTAPHMSAKLTSRMAHEMMHAPPALDPIQALRYGQIIGLGGTPALARLVYRHQVGSHLYREDREAFLVTVLQWLVNHPELPRRQVGPLLDFLMARIQRDPEFEMKGRSTAGLLRLMIEWHTELRQLRMGEIHTFRLSPEPRSHELWDDHGGQWWMIEIGDSAELHAEGTAMRHCVYSYLFAVREGHCSIWSLKRRTAQGLERALTLEVRGTAVVQARGFANRMPTGDERDVLLRWAKEQGLRIAV